MLVWFALSIGVAIASPVINPSKSQLICSGSGVMKMVVLQDDGSTEEIATRMLDCPLCASFGAPPPKRVVSAQAAQPLGYALQPIPAAHIAAITGAPPPARGPPAFS